MLLYVSGLDKITTLIVLVNLRNCGNYGQAQLEKLKLQCFSQVSNLVLSSSSSGCERVSLHFLHHFINDDQAEI